MVTTRSANSDRDRVTWAAGGIRVMPSPTVNHAYKKSVSTNRPLAKKDTKKKKTLTTDITPERRVTRGQIRASKSTKIRKVATRSTKSTKSTKKVAKSSKDKPKKVSSRQQQERALPNAQSRRSARLTERATNPSTISLPAPTQTTPHASQPTSAPQAPESVDENPPASATELDAEITMEEYIDSVDLRIHAAETRELLKAALEAPFWYDEYPRALYTEAIRVYHAISSGRINNFQEALQIPLEDHFWAEEVAVDPVVSEIEPTVFE